jgi:hypothetical protein
VPDVRASAQDLLVAVSTLINVAELPEPLSVHVSKVGREHALINVHTADAMKWRNAIDGTLPWTRHRAIVGDIYQSVGSWRGLTIAVCYYQPDPAVTV